MKINFANYRGDARELTEILEEDLEIELEDLEVDSKLEQKDRRAFKREARKN